MMKTEGKIEIVAIGGSTGSPNAVQQILSRLDINFPVPILVVLHMPPHFTRLFAERLNELSALNVKEAVDGDAVRPGEVLIAPGDQHLLVYRKGRSKVYVKLSKTTDRNLSSIDKMMASVAEVYRDRSLGVILTGMGADGVEGMKSIRERGGITLAQDKASCIVYGMPRACVESGIIDKVVPLSILSEKLAALTAKYQSMEGVTTGK